MDNNKKTTKFLPQGHAPVVKKQQLRLHTFSDTTEMEGASSSLPLPSRLSTQKGHPTLRWMAFEKCRA